MFSAEELQKDLSTRFFGKKIIVYETIDSTNTRAKELATTGSEEGTVIIADYQTGGRGRHGRSWFSDPGCNLLFSIVIRPVLTSEKVGLLAFFAPTGIAMAVEAVTGKPCECRWPNDVLLNNRKCSGILLESSFQQQTLDYAVIGVGLNVNQKKFSENLENTATSLARECGKEFDRKTVFQQVLMTLDSLYADVRTGVFSTILHEWKSRAMMFGKSITLTQDKEEIAGEVIGISDNGGLILETTAGRRTFHAGNVTVKNKTTKNK